jgi:hypothetical protein
MIMSGWDKSFVHCHSEAVFVFGSWQQAFWDGIRGMHRAQGNIKCGHE